MRQKKNSKLYIIFLCIFMVLLVFLFAFNIWMRRIVLEEEKYYLVEINQAMQEIKKDPKFTLDDSYRYLVDFEKIRIDIGEEAFYGREYSYEIRLIDDQLYRFDYRMDISTWQEGISRMINAIFLFFFLFLMGVFYYLWKHMLKPFGKIEEMPYNLSKGILNEGLKEEKTKYFGKFIWGLDLLRDKLEMQKKEELKLQKEKKTLILSISHDIKTPLSAIKLYTKALEDNLYESKKEREDVICSIGKHVDEIEEFVSQIAKASREDFLKLDVEMEELFLYDLMDGIDLFYKGKMNLLRIPFTYEKKENCLLHGDLNRLEEILQNIIENAIKYGDGLGIRIKQMQEEYSLLLTVSNTGTTLSEDELPHIFDEFWRGSNVKAEEGSGLGLYICKELIQKMGGDIYARIQGDEMQVTIVIRMV